MKSILGVAFLATAAAVLTSCGTTPRKSTHRPTTAHKTQPVRISNIDHAEDSQELMLHSMGLIGTPYRWGGNRAEVGFDCSGMIQFVYKNALGASLPHATHNMTAASYKIPDGKLKADDLVFFSTGEAHEYSHVGLYINNGEFIHAPSDDKAVRTEKPSEPFYTRNYLGVHTSFID